ncbi:hypothetical protein [Paenibacillus planticolens]|uniref:Uncharacterized protein n=1 Tax=Paenibacillus planticolens TaxID=2654976 RepID=A0ABX1ZPA1_9BACL|nr:hypothetical protein [Paenibacillus planticolens]NOV01915.1 hypothetical protein [Paenibacillus planticolens]
MLLADSLRTFRLDTHANDFDPRNLIYNKEVTLNRITTLYPYQLSNDNHTLNELYEIYRNFHILPDIFLADCRPLDHTMSFSVDEYVIQKLPTSYMDQALADGFLVEVHGIHWKHFEVIYGILGYSNISKIDFEHNLSTKQFNYERPKYYYAERYDKKVLLLCVAPGQDYLVHYSNLIKHFIKLRTTKPDILKVFWYPLAEQSLPFWTGINNELIMPGDRIILGYVGEFNKLLDEELSCLLISRYENSYFCISRYKLNDSFVCLLGVKFSFWGCISAKLVSHLCQLGCSEIIYAAKLGALSSTEDLYNKVFSPTKYLILRHNQILGEICDVKNPIADLFPEINTGWHVSVPTVLEENYQQREIINRYHALSIDNEISQMALAISNYNKEKLKAVTFVPLHFATDYVRDIPERLHNVLFDLSNNRSFQAIEAKNLVLDKLFTYLLAYLKL